MLDLAQIPLPGDHRLVLGPGGVRRGPGGSAQLVSSILRSRADDAEAADQAKVICFLASSDADFGTGVTIDVTGGN